MSSFRSGIREDLLIIEDAVPFTSSSSDSFFSNRHWIWETESFIVESTSLTIDDCTGDVEREQKRDANGTTPLKQMKLDFMT